MKRIIYGISLFVLLAVLVSASTQYFKDGHAKWFTNKFAIGSDTAALTAIFQVTDADRGVIFPKMAGTHRDSITSPTEGLLVYNNTSHAYSVYNGTNWISSLNYTRTYGAAPGAISPIIYTKKLTTTTTGGLATDTMTLTGGSAGTAIFSHIYSATATAVYSDTITTAIPLVYISSIGGSNKTITVRAISYNSGFKPAAVSTDVYLTVIGD